MGVGTLGFHTRPTLSENPNYSAAKEAQCTGVYVVSGLCWLCLHSCQPAHEQIKLVDVWRTLYFLERTQTPKLLKET